MALLDHEDWSAAAGRVVVPRSDEGPTDNELMTVGLETATFVTANAFVRRAALARVGGFDERFGAAWREDSDLQFRLEDEVGRGAVLLIGRFAWCRLARTSRRRADVVEMVCTSALIPYVSVYWRLRGAARWRAPFL